MTGRGVDIHGVNPWECELEHELEPRTEAADTEGVTNNHES